MDINLEAKVLMPVKKVFNENKRKMQEKLKATFKNEIRLKIEDSNLPLMKNDFKPVAQCLDNKDSESNETMKKINFLTNKTQKFDDVYEEREKLGQGCHAIVKKVIRKLDGQEFAVKITRVEDPEIIRSIIQEFENCFNINHPSITKVYDLFIDEKRGRVYLVMEYVPFMSLNKFLRSIKESLIKEIDIAKITFNILEATRSIHAQGICHRDLTPFNILVDTKSDIKIIDFGISKKVTRVAYTKAGYQKTTKKMYTSTGVLSYQAPEMLSGEGYSKKVDNWAIGVIIYEMMCGLRPFDQEYVSDTIEKICSPDENHLFSEEKWKFRTSFGMSICKDLLKKGAHERLKIKDAMKHLWFSQILGESFSVFIQKSLFIRLHKSSSLKAKENKKPLNTPNNKRVLLRKKQSRKSVEGREFSFQCNSPFLNNTSISNFFKKIHATDISPNSYIAPMLRNKQSVFAKGKLNSKYQEENPVVFLSDGDEKRRTRSDKRHKTLAQNYPVSDDF